MRSAIFGGVFTLVVLVAYLVVTRSKRPKA